MPDITEARLFPNLLVPVEPLDRSSDAWSVYYNFDQFLWSPEGDPDRGVGVFFRFGASDGVVNPVRWAYNVGFSANGIVPGRPRDSFGIGWARAENQQRLRPVPARAPWSRTRFGARDRDLLQRRHHSLALRHARPADHRPGARQEARLLRTAAHRHGHGGHRRPAPLRALLLSDRSTARGAPGLSRPGELSRSGPRPAGASRATGGPCPCPPSSPASPPGRRE